MARKKIVNNNHNKFIKDINYRPFDTRSIYYSPDMVDWGRKKMMQHFIKGDNIGINLVRRSRNNIVVLPFITKNIVDKGIASALDNANVFPLYLYSETNGQPTIKPTAARIPNLNLKIVAQIEQSVALTFINEKEDRENTFAPIDILDYIYAVLHSLNYREQYKEFLKIDFPRVPYPKDQNTFWQLVHLGGQLRKIHLLESPVVENYITQYPADGDNKVAKPVYKNGNVYINDVQYFANVPEIAWNFYIGGYQPAQKWLKDRKDRILAFEDILHYQKIIVALTETDKLMHEIDEVLI